MTQLRMDWTNDHLPMTEPVLAAHLRCCPLPTVEDGITKWLDVVQYGLTASLQEESYYHRVMTNETNYCEDMCYLVMDGNEAVATFTVICDYDAPKAGYIHMVACKDSARGQGIGKWMSDMAVYLLKQHNMETAHLTTDDFRIPAIKTYLYGHFVPTFADEDHQERWRVIFDQLGAAYEQYRP